MTVMMVGAVMLIMMATLFVRSVADYNQAGDNRRWSRALHVADSGVDYALNQLAEDMTWSTVGPLPVFASEEDERTWVVDQAELQPTAPDLAPEGEWVVVKPDDLAVIYAVGYVPTRAAPQRVRILRAEYDFAPFAPGNALLSDGDLQISGSLDVQGDTGNIHANGIVVSGGSASASGYISASGGTCANCESAAGDPANSGPNRPPREVPSLDPLAMYEDVAQYDLCPDGTVHAGPLYAGAEGPNPTGEPCQGPALEISGGYFNGWSFGGQTNGIGSWNYNTNTEYDGSYFVHHGNATVGSHPGRSSRPWRVSIFGSARAVGAEPHCPHEGGDIDIQGHPVMAPSDVGSPFLLMAGRDLVITGGTDGGTLEGEGVMAAHEQFYVRGDLDLHGILLSNDKCDTPGSPTADNSVSGNATIIHNGTGEVPLGGMIRTTHWLEL